MLLLLDLLGVTVEEHVDHDVPAVRCPGNGAPETEDLTGQQPPDETDGMAGLVVGGDRNVNELEGRVGVAKGNHGDVDV